MAKTKIGDQVRQGDVLLVRVARNKAGKPLVKGTRIVLAEGETTGHSHSLSADAVTAYAPGAFGGKMVIVVDAPTPLVHEEHSTIELLRGAFEVVEQYEYQPEELRRVMD